MTPPSQRKGSAGRGTWSATGLLPHGEDFVYRLPVGKEKPIGPSWHLGRPSQKDTLMRDGVRAIQLLLGVERTGIYDEPTAAAAERATGSSVLGVLEMRSILLPHITRLAAAAGVSGHLAEGCLRELGAFDPAAQKVDAPHRVGLALMPAGGSMNAMDPITALEYVSNSLRVLYGAYNERRVPDPWACAVLHLLDPAGAEHLARQGDYATVADRRFVADVLT